MTSISLDSARGAESFGISKLGRDDGTMLFAGCSFHGGDPAVLRWIVADGEASAAGADTLDGMPSGDLFALANAIADLLDAPITIEDRGSRVLAFSSGQDAADPVRIQTILGRQVPEPYSRLLTERGVFRELYCSDEPVFIPVLSEDPAEMSLPRVAVAVRAGDEVLGSVWATLTGPLSVERTQALRDAAKLVALQMLRIRAGTDVERRRRAYLLSTALDGGTYARDALRRLRLADHPVIVFALAITGPDVTSPTVHGEVDLTAKRQRITDAFAMHLSAVHPRCAAALVGDTVFGLLPVASGGVDAQCRATRIATEFVDRVGDRTPVVVAVSPTAFDASDLPAARACAQRTLRVLCNAGPAKRNVARLDDVQADALLLDLRDLVITRGEQPTGAIARLLDYDEQHKADLVETLRAWLDAFGDVIAAAAAIHVHPNTLRYRLRRLAEVGGLDLADPNARFAAMLQLRLRTDKRLPD